jgi:hypothetical protein
MLRNSSLIEREVISQISLETHGSWLMAKKKRKKKLKAQL